MKYTRKHILATYFSLLSVLTLAIAAPAVHDGSNMQLLSLRASVGVPSVLANAVAVHPNTQEYRVALRLRNRLYKQGKGSPPLKALASAIRERQELFGNTVTAEVLTYDGNHHSTWNISLHAHPEWLMPSFSFTDAAYVLDTNAMEQYLEASSLPGVIPPEDIEFSGIQEDKGVIRAATTGVAKSGQVIDIPITVANVAEAILSGTESITVQLLQKHGVMRNGTNEDFGQLVLVASGKSNFAGSTYSRGYNVRKALREHVNNTYVAPGETFSFNGTLGGPVTESRGWRMAKVIFGGSELRPAAGGGICQASTTVYRAIVNAGFPVVERRSHSLYVSYYKKYGVGIDATIFPGYQDLTFVNDTGQPLVIQAYSTGDEAVVNVYGTPDGRTVDLQGPYFSSSYPDSLYVNERRISRNEVVWTQKITYPSGETKENTIVSRYKELPSYVQAEFAYGE
jgi:vancomycin resistance protein YoaR